MSDEENYSANKELDEDQESAEEELNLDEDENEDVDADESDLAEEQENSQEEDSQGNVEEEEEEVTTTGTKLAKTKKVINTKKLSKYTTADDNKGVIYLSSIPMFMSPSRLRAMMSQFGEIGSLYLAPEGKDSQKSRKKNGGNGRKRWIEGWVEFMDKKIASRVAESLNGTPVGGTKRSKFYDQLWNIKYLKGVKWRHLKEQMGILLWYHITNYPAYEISVRKSKLRAQISRGKREMEEYRKNFETSKRIAKRKRIEAEKANNTQDNDNDTPSKQIKPLEKKTQKIPLEKPTPKPTITDPRFNVDNSSKWNADFDDLFGETREDEPQSKAKKKIKSK